MSRDQYVALAYALSFFGMGVFGMLCGMLLEHYLQRGHRRGPRE